MITIAGGLLLAIGILVGAVVALSVLGGMLTGLIQSVVRILSWGITTTARVRGWLLAHMQPDAHA